MPTVKLSDNEKKAMKVGRALGGAVAGAVAGAVSGAVKATANRPSQPVAVGVVPVAQPVAQPVYVQQPRQQVTVVHVQPQPAPHGMQAGQIVSGVANAAAYALGGTDYPPRDACLCCGTGCCYQALTSRNWARCHNDMRCCCLSCETCCCSGNMIRGRCCVDNLGCRSPTFECCHCGGGCCQCKIVSPYHTGELCIGHSQCCFQVSAWAVSSSGCEKVGVPFLVTCIGINCYPTLG
jgi:hypothetical protein